MNVTLPNGMVIQGVPDDFTKAQLVEKLANNGYDTSWYTPEVVAPVSTPEQPPQDQGFLESMGKGFLETALGASKAYGGATEGTYKTAQQQAEEAAKEQGLAVGLGRAAPILGATVPAMAAIPATVAGMGTLGAMGASTALAAPTMSGVQGGSRYSEVLDKTGGDEATALKAGIASGLMAAGSVALPMSAGGRVLGTSLLGKAGEGAVINMGTGIADRAIQNQITGDYSNLRQDLLDPTALALEGGMGAVFGGMSPSATPKGIRPVTDTTPVRPPPLEQATAEQLAKLTSREGQIIDYRPALEAELAKAEAKVAKYPDQQYLVDNAQKKLDILDSELASVRTDIQTVQRGGKEPAPPLPKPSEVEELTTQHVEAKRKANEIAAKSIAEEKAGRLTEAELLRTEAEKLIEVREAIKSELKAARQAEEALALAPEAPPMQGEVPPYMPTTPEAPTSSLAAQGRASSIYAGEGADTDAIHRAFDIDNFRGQSAEVQAYVTANKEAKLLKGGLSRAARANIESELDQIYGRAPRKVPPTLSPRELQADLDEIDNLIPETPPTGSQGELPLPTQIVPEKIRLEGELSVLTEHANTLRQKNGSKPSTRQVAKRAEYDRLMVEIRARTDRIRELDIAQAREDAKHMDFSQEVPQFKTPPTTIAGLRTAVETGGWVAGLNHVIANLPETNILSTISKALLKNKWINPAIKYKDIPQQGRYQLGTENIELSSMKSPDSATALVHEVVHRGTSNAIEQFAIDPSKLTSRERRAINQLTALYNSVKDIPRVAGTKPVSNMKEFLAYGLSHEGFASWLNTLKGVEKASTFKKLINSVMDLLGFDPKVRTAYSELAGIGEALISQARAINPQAERATLIRNISRGLGLQNIDTLLKYTQDQLATMVKAGQVSDIGLKSSTLFKNVFGKLQLKEIWDNPVINYVGEVVRRAEANGVKLNHTLRYGVNPDSTRGVGKLWISLKQYIGNNSVYKTFHDLTPEMGATLHDWNKRFFDENITVDGIKTEMKDLGLDPADWFNHHLAKRTKQLEDANVPKKVIDAYVSEKKAINDMFEDNNRVLKEQGRSPIPVRPDYYPAVRKGQFAVSVFANDLIYRVQLFRTELEAKLFQEKMSAYPEYKTTYENMELSRETTANLDDLTDFAKDVFDRLGMDADLYGLTNALDQMTTTGMKFGKHQLFRQGVGGYAGSEWFKTRTELGDAYRNTIFDWIDEQTSIRVKQEIKFNTERLLKDDVVRDAIPNAIGMASHIRDMGLNTVPEWGWAKVFDKQVRDSGDGLIHNAAKMFGKKDFVAKVSPVDKSMGVMSSMFYLTTLMGRPGFWVSQVLTAPSSIRHILRDTDVPLMDIISAFSKGSMRSFGAVPHDAVSAAVMRHLVDNTTTLRPQLQNELNTIKWMEAGSGKKFAEVMRLITGQSPAEAADIVSRVWTANIMIEHYSRKGLKGMELIDAVANATDLTMVAYNRSNKAAWVDKAGILGQAANPLLTYGTAQLGNLVSDISFMARERTLRSALPALSTMLVTQLMAGAIGLPILVEYQFLRDMFVEYDESLDWLPDPKRILMESPAWMERGIPSAVTGMDVGSGMRWNPFLAKFFLEDNQSLIDVFPAIAFMGQVGKAAGMQLKEASGIGSYTEAEKRKASLAITPMVGGKALVDAVAFGSTERAFVPGGRSYAVVEQTPKEHLATLLGTRTVERARIQDAEFSSKQEKRRIASKQQKLIDLIADQGQHSEDALTELVEQGVTGPEINELLTTAYENRNIPIAQRMLMGGSGPAGKRELLRVIQGYGTALGLNKD